LTQEISKKFESEIRIFVNDISSFLERLKNLDAELVLTYSFKDHLFKPKEGSINDWDPNRKTMRLRAWSHPETYSQILFSKTEIWETNDLQYKRTCYPQGKIELFHGDFESAKELLEDWGFIAWFTVEKLKGELFKIRSPSEFVIALENLEHIGWMVEIECWGGNVKEVSQKISERMQILGVTTEDITFKSCPRIVAEKLGLFF